MNDLRCVVSVLPVADRPCRGFGDNVFCSLHCSSGNGQADCPEHRVEARLSCQWLTLSPKPLYYYHHRPPMKGRLRVYISKSMGFRVVLIIK